MASLSSLTRIFALQEVNKIITKQVPYSSESRIRFNQAEGCFEEIASGADSISKGAGSYFFVDELKTILELTGYSFSGNIHQQREVFAKAAEDFKNYSGVLRNIEEHPEKVGEEDSEEINGLLKVCNELEYFYSSKEDEEIPLEED